MQAKKYGTVYHHSIAHPDTGTYTVLEKETWRSLLRCRQVCAYFGTAQGIQPARRCWRARRKQGGFSHYSCAVCCRPSAVESVQEEENPLRIYGLLLPIKVQPIPE